jgi:hypothetical protein
MNKHFRNLDARLHLGYAKHAIVHAEAASVRRGSLVNSDVHVASVPKRDHSKADRLKAKTPSSTRPTSATSFLALIGRFAQHRKRRRLPRSPLHGSSRKNHGSFRSRVRPNCIASKKTPEPLPSNLRPTISGSSKALRRRFRSRENGIPKNCRN